MEGDDLLDRLPCVPRDHLQISPGLRLVADRDLHQSSAIRLLGTVRLPQKTLDSVAEKPTIDSIRIQQTGNGDKSRNDFNHAFDPEMVEPARKGQDTTSDHCVTALADGDRHGSIALFNDAGHFCEDPDS